MWIGCASTAYGREEEHERGLVRDDTARDRVADHQHRGHEQALTGVEEHAPEREPQHLAAARRIAHRPPRPEAEARAPARDEQHADEREHAAGSGDREQQPLARPSARSRDADRPATRKSARHTTITIVLPIGATAVTTNRRRA